MGNAGISQICLLSHANAGKLKNAINKIPGYKVLFNVPFLYELVVTSAKPIKEIQDRLSELGIQAGFDLSKDYPELGNAMLCCVTETKSDADIEQFIEALQAC